MEPTRRSKKFCSDRCRLYHFRETSTKPSANKNRKANATQGSQLPEPEIVDIEQFDFGDDAYLVIEKYTKFPMKERPAQRVDRYKWDMEKEAYDLKIKEAWEKRRHNVS